MKFRSDLCLFLSASLRVPVLRSLRLSLTGRYRSTDLHYSHSFNVTVSYHISSKFGSIYLSISFSFASYPYALFTPAFADGAVQISLSISLALPIPPGARCGREPATTANTQLTTRHSLPSLIAHHCFMASCTFCPLVRSHILRSRSLVLLR